MSAGVHPKRVAGTIFVKIDGEQVAAKGSFEYRLSGLQNSVTMNADGSMAVGGEHLPGYIKGTISNYNETDHAGIKNAEAVTVTLEQANGKVVVAKDAIQVDESVGNVSDGEFSVEFDSDNVEEIR